MRLVALFAAIFLAACGQTGSLYLPDEGVETPVDIRSPATAPASTPPAPVPEPDDDEDDAKDAPPPGS
ncbi:MAG: lipoprotein [Pseudomonadota bacterium]|nr:lipoprotein [Pseudomonadota bacterium]